MRVLVVGSGGREHALAWRLSQAPEDPSREVLCAPGSAGIAAHATCVEVAVDDIEGQVALAKERAVDLVVVGPELPLSLGLVDALDAAGVPALGPSAAAAELEGSKAFAKEVMERAGVPTAGFGVADTPAAARALVRSLGGQVAVKADGLAAGKGVILARSIEEGDAAVAALMEEGAVGAAGQRVVVESLLEGEEASFIALCDGERVLPLAGSQDHKAAYDGDQGPNTGGMGAVSPAPVLTPELAAQVVREVMEPTVQAMAALGRPFKGVLYAGLMIGPGGVKVLEFNARFGDPETQALMARVDGDLAPALLAAAQGDLRGVSLRWDPRAAVCVVLASEGYPGPYPKGRPISGIDAANALEGVTVFEAGTREGATGRETAGGRVLGVTALGEGIAGAQARAYEAVAALKFEGAHWRSDIGYRALAHETEEQ